MSRPVLGAPVACKVYTSCLCSRRDNGFDLSEDTGGVEATLGMAALSESKTPAVNANSGS